MIASDEGLSAGLLEDPQGTGCGDGLRAAADAQLAVDVGGVGLDRSDGDDQLVGNLAIAQPLCDERQHFQLAQAERLEERLFKRGTGNGMGLRLAGTKRLQQVAGVRADVAVGRYLTQDLHQRIAQVDKAAHHVVWLGQTQGAGQELRSGLLTGGSADRAYRRRG